MEIDPPEFQTRLTLLERFALKIREYREVRAVRRTFSKYLRPAAVKQTEKKTGWFINPPEVRHFQYVVVGLEELEFEKAALLMGRVLEAFYKNHGLISTYSPFLMIASWGTLRDAPDSVEDRLATVADVLAENGQLVRIAHGQATGIVGVLGGRHRFTYGPLIPGFQEIQDELSKAEFGTAFEVPEKGVLLNPGITQPRSGDIH